MQVKPKLTKEEEAAVRAQLEKENAIRGRVTRVQAQGLGAIAVVHALLVTPVTQPALHGFLPALVKTLIFPQLSTALLHHEAGELFLVRQTSAQRGIAPADGGHQRYRLGRARRRCHSGRRSCHGASRPSCVP